jgi:hypothetical protein
MAKFLPCNTALARRGLPATTAVSIAGVQETFMWKSLNRVRKISTHSALVK